MTYQNAWLAHFYPKNNEIIHLDHDPWFYLHQYMLPLIMQHASHYHIEGIFKLKLNLAEKPDFAEFKNNFAEEANGFTIEMVDEEILYAQVIGCKYIFAAQRKHQQHFHGPPPHSFDHCEVFDHGFITHRM